MRLLAYRSVPCVFWKFEVRERLGLKIGGGEVRSLASYSTVTTDGFVGLYDCCADSSRTEMRAVASVVLRHLRWLFIYVVILA